MRNKINQHIKVHHNTFLGVGPMSQHSIDSSIEIAYETGKPLALIPSRRQIDAEELGGGYVNNWNTRQFASYVRSRDPKKLIVLCRDHSGPWQGLNEESLTFEMALKQSLISLEDDIKNGFDLLHIDPSQGFAKGRTEGDIIKDIVHLIEICESYSSAARFFTMIFLKSNLKLGLTNRIFYRRQLKLLKKN